MREKLSTMQKTIDVVGGNIPILCKVRVDPDAIQAGSSYMDLKFIITNLSKKSTKALPEKL